MSDGDVTIYAPAADAGVVEPAPEPEPDAPDEEDE